MRFYMMLFQLLHLVKLVMAIELHRKFDIPVMGKKREKNYIMVKVVCYVKNLVFIIINL